MTKHQDILPPRREQHSIRAEILNGASIRVMVEHFSKWVSGTEPVLGLGGWHPRSELVGSGCGKIGLLMEVPERQQAACPSLPPTSRGRHLIQTCF